LVLEDRPQNEKPPRALLPGAFVRDGYFAGAAPGAPAGLSFGGTPMTYASPKTGRQYVVLTAGGSNGPEKGDYVIAYALP